MLTDAPLPVVVSAVFLLGLTVLLAVVALPTWWRGTATIHPDTPPPGWALSPALWRRLARGLVVSVPMLGSAALVVIASRVSVTLADILVAPVIALAVLWLALVLFARPRSLIPPPWRP